MFDNVLDYAGNKVEVGDFIVVGMRRGNSGMTRVGQVVSFKANPKEWGSGFNLSMRVRWEFKYCTDYDTPKESSLVLDKDNRGHGFLNLRTMAKDIMFDL